MSINSSPIPPVDDEQNVVLPGNAYQYSHLDIALLGATEQTVTGAVWDVSGSVDRFRNELVKAQKAVVTACMRSPRADNLVMRTTNFADGIVQVHGFLPLAQIQGSMYDQAFQTGGLTALYAASEEMALAVNDFGRKLIASDMSANGIIFVGTDGDNNRPGNIQAVKAAFDKCTQSEALESLTKILIGVNVTDPAISAYLRDFKQVAGFDEYIEIGNADGNSLAKLASFISQSISLTSQALGSGGPSQQLLQNAQSLTF